MPGEWYGKVISIGRGAKEEKNDSGGSQIASFHLK